MLVQRSIAEHLRGRDKEMCGWIKKDGEDEGEIDTEVEGDEATGCAADIRGGNETLG